MDIFSSRAKRSNWRVLFILLGCLAGGVLVAGQILAFLSSQTLRSMLPVAQQVAAGDSAGASLAGEAQQALAGLPLRFIPNAGQTDPAVQYIVHTGGQTIFFTPEEIVFRMISGAASAQAAPGTIPEPGNGRAAERSVVRLRFEGACAHPAIEARQPLPGKVDFFLGNDPAQWQTNVSTFGEVVYRDVYPGVELTFRGVEGRLTYELNLAPGVDPSVIQMVFDGAEQISLREDGLLLLQTPGGEMTVQAPLIYQKVAGQRQIVHGGYELRAQADSWRVAFQVMAYDPAFPLVIDPELVFSSFLGGSQNDYGWDIAVDNAGNIYVTGDTVSSDFVITPDAVDATPDTNWGDAYVTQLIRAGGVYTYGFSTYLGGSDRETGYGIAVDESGGRIYVVGYTESSDFPTTTNAIDGNLSGAEDAFLAQIGNTGGVRTLEYASYLGGSSNDMATAVAVDGLGRFYVTGITLSGDFPVQNPLDQYLDGSSDAFVTQVINASNRAAYGYSTYLGGDYGEIGFGIAVDGDGNAYVTGYTSSNNFPLKNPVQGSLLGSQDVFVTKIIDTGVYTYGFSTYLGGSGDDQGYAIALDADGQAYVTGITFSNDFPVLNALDDSLTGEWDAFVAAIAPTTGLNYSSYLGGSGGDDGRGIGVDQAGYIYVAGHTSSKDFPLVNAFDTTMNGEFDAFVTQIAPSGSGYTYGYSTYLGGNYAEVYNTLAVGNDGSVYVTGQTNSTQFPLRNPVDGTPNNGDAFIAKIGPNLPDLVIVKRAAPTGTVPPGTAITYTLVYTNQGPQIATGVLITDMVPAILTGVTYTSSGAVILPTGEDDFVWEAAMLGLGQGGIITITGMINPQASGAFTLTNQATIQTSDETYTDTNLLNNDSSASIFVDGEAPLPPALVSPANGATLGNDTPALTWQASASPDAAGYLLKFNNTVQDVGNVTQYTTTTLPNGVYTWTVAAYDAFSNTSPYTDTWSFTVDVFAPSPQLYVAGLTGADSGDCRNPASPCQTVGYAVAQAVAGDTVLIAAGVYTETLSVSTPITVSGGYVPSGVLWQARTGETIINGNGAGTVVSFLSGSSGALLDGLTITGGNGTMAGGIDASSQDVTVRNCYVHDNVANGAPYSQGGGGILGGIGDSQLVIENSRIVHNQISEGAGGVRVHSGMLVMTNTLVADNHGDWGLHLNSAGVLMNVTIANNSNGLLFNASAGKSLAVTNSIIYGNGQAVANPGAGSFLITYSDVEGGWAGIGNIDADPLFVDASSGDYHLQISSLCSDHGTSAGAPPTDLEGTPRDTQPDMGAYELVAFHVYLPVAIRH